MTRSELLAEINTIRMVGIDAIEYVGSANYPEREQDALTRFCNAINRFADRVAASANNPAAQEKSSDSV